MTFEKKLRDEIRSLPVRGLTDDRRQAILERMQKTDGRRGSLRGVSSTIAAVIGVAAILIGTMIATRDANHRSPLTWWTTARVESSALNTKSFRNAVQTYLETHINSGSSSITIPSSGTNNPGTSGTVVGEHAWANIEGLTVRWSQLEGNFGYAFVSFRKNQDDYVAMVFAQKESTFQWTVLRLESGGPVSQIDLNKFPIYNMGMSAGGIGIQNLPTYFMTCGIILDPSITRVRITWPDGHQNEVQVTNGVYGNVATNPPTAHSVAGPKNIEGFTADGRLVYHQF